MEFPAILTANCGVSKTVADLLRPCMQNSVGPQRFQKILREIHTLRHDRLELQYLISAYSRKHGIAAQLNISIQPNIQPFSSFDDQNLYAGYVPTGTYFRTLYTAIIEKLQPKMDKHTMLLDGKVLKCDHSFKFPKHMAKIEETSVFTALFTVTNEYEEIVHQVLVPSKSLIYLKHSLQKMREAYDFYGHALPIAFFTDNVKSDKIFLESIFESLKVEASTSGSMVTPDAELNPLVASHAESNYLELPNDVNILYIARNFGQVNEEMKKFTAILSADKAMGIDVVFGFDLEWHGSIGDFVDVMQITYDKTVYIIHIDRSWKELPPYLIGLLRSTEYKKVGRNIGGDFARIQRRYHFHCKAQIELGSFLSRRKLISRGSMSLSEISLQILGVSINKGPRQSVWNISVLTDEMIKYAAIDAWAGLAIYHAAIIIPVIGCRVKELGCPLGTAVGIKPPRYDQIVAHGVLQNNNDLATIQVTKVNVPSWIAPPFADLQAGIALRSYGQPPFQMKIPIKYLITVSSNPDVPAPVPSTPYEPIDTMESNSNNITMNDISDAEIQQKMQEMFGEAVDEVDKAGFIRGYKQFATIPSAATGNVEKANTRVVKDIFHLMDMIKPYKKHSLYKSFTRKFSESLFTIDEDDKSKIIEAFAKAKAADHQFPHDWESKMKYDRGWLWKRFQQQQQQQQQNQHQCQEQQQLPIPRMAHSPSPVIRRQPLTASGIYRPHHPYYVNTRIIIPRTTRTCRGCGRKPEECKGASKRSRCTQPKCLKCGRSAECNGIWDRTKCNY
ncbi:hypothetical protein [Parasitella parasitica]|uniref:3'-5' exonuclease domain-containing protein n=1 Tax=Parasitella parasitica TaxID=35722 RepID=A0A0B7ND58_9FUNG|nr:hypothetical protein [Parasitella parasitica]